MEAILDGSCAPTLRRWLAPVAFTSLLAVTIDAPNGVVADEVTIVEEEITTEEVDDDE